jgi:uncharacterized protein YggE
MIRSLNRHVFALAGAFALLIPTLAQAEDCHDEIARAQTLIDQAKAGSAEVPDMPETNFATMHRQPTRQSVAQAKGEALQKASALLDQARKQEAEGHPAECLTTLRTIVMP